MTTLEYDDKKYEFDWVKIAVFFIGTPLLALAIWFSHDWIWLHKISADFTVWLLNLFTNGESYLYFNNNPYYAETPWTIQIITATGVNLGPIVFETLCTGVHAIAIFTAAILFTPHSLDYETSKDIWKRKTIAILVTGVVFYLVNIFRMILQLGLYRNGSIWDDIHYPISSASSFIAVACVLLMHKWVPEFIMSLIWIGDELKVMLKKSTPLDDEEGIVENEGDLVKEAAADPETYNAELEAERTKNASDPPK
jgi:exosortase/archaeosortase family protein